MAIHVSIEGYDNLEQIGVGGMAAVYRARQISIGKTVAVKVLFPYLASDESFIERFQREARAAARVQHENIVNVIDFGDSDGAWYIVMEYYDGGTLEDLIKNRKSLPLDIAVQVLLEVCYGLEAAHATDIVHRDIKPGNIIFTKQGGIKVADFGLAKKSDSMTMITQQGKVIGTPAYMSPEQAAGRNVGPASDIFSLGVVAYELFCCEKPFAGKSYSEVLERIQTHEPPSVMSINPLIQPDFERIVARMLMKDESRRYAAVADVIADFESAMEKMNIVRDRRRLTQYVTDPDAYDQKYTEKMVARCLSQGTYFMQKGETHLDEAILEFRRILHIDPENERARYNLNRIRSERRSANTTGTVDAAKTAVMSVSDRRPAAAAAPQRAPGAPTRRGRRSVAVVVTIAAVALAGVGAISWRMLVAKSGKAGVELTGKEVGPAPIFPAPDSIPIFVADASGAGAEPAQPLPEPQERGQEAAPTTPANDAVPAAKPRGPGKVEWRLPESADIYVDGALRKKAARDFAIEISPGRHTLQAELTTGVIGWSEIIDVGAGNTTRLAARPLSYGTLSVYYLGAVGDFQLNGKVFREQPPFTAVAVPAGTHAVNCRMQGEARGHDLTVTVEAGRETVIEYEVGKVPTISIEG